MADPSGPRWRKRTARFDEIAALAGVSTTTVDRVLNERGSVSARARERVVAAARQLGVPRQLPDTRHGLLHVDVLLPDTDAPFFHRLQQALQRSLQMLDRRVVVRRTIVAAADDARAAALIERPAYRRAALIVTTHDTPRVRDALTAAIARGEHVVTMVTDIGGIARVHYAGIDNYRAGRTAGYYIGRLAARPGRVLLLGGRMAYRAHAQRMAGCMDQLGEAFGALRCDAPIETLDDDDRCYRAVTNALRAGDEVAAIYNSGAGSAGIEAALRNAGAAGRVVWIGHEMLGQHRAYIEAGSMDIAIDQDPDGQAISALQHVLHACGIVEQRPPADPVEFRVFCAANVRTSAYLQG
ncbi:LacI family DNA-binding transcriptional regulator [Burkholderia multivorans]|uniref:LacI family DNA-binding transcriptional regulator n=1 Tax=Burkholderia multivorans TaxID=87883 RepID=UPI000CFF573A|nr:LacI family DNA-binding transcriptional regulator [Burkholderia multivorans]MBR7890793.1 LacI family DNA-binding transcriptional regulator [Burkholderia multivorans]MBR8453486.1 LacI family DNA-binding transcriptional regulator [Burkholderia multivorans]MBU9449680.1 LacI family DNA-binding transcriptional regulator [Burkholderia multivorans]MCL4648219.1 LacI family DNA-binding transcriptional regulator [Burkholderia multivorans]PRG33142.1 sugar ABC transporter substrate-binding protein [Bur